MLITNLMQSPTIEPFSKYILLLLEIGIPCLIGEVRVGSVMTINRGQFRSAWEHGRARTPSP